MISPSQVAYRPGGSTALQYCSVYRLLIAALTEGSDTTSKEAVSELISGVKAAQDPNDGLFKDPAVASCNDDADDSWGWRHLTAQALNALTLFGEQASHPLRFCHFLLGRGQVRGWLDSLDWDRDPAATSNAVMNYGVALQYERDYLDNTEAQAAVEEMLDWLDRHHDPTSGSWGVHAQSPVGRSLAVQTAYHMWVLYFYEGRPIPSLRAAIDSCLATQTSRGGYGFLPNTSACEDIDSIQPLAWFLTLTDYRREEILQSLARAWTWSIANQVEDGSFVFRIGEPFKYGNCPQMSSGRNEGALFSTWFRLLALAYIRTSTMGRHGPSEPAIHFGRSPGYQSWH